MSEEVMVPTTTDPTFLAEIEWRSVRNKRDQLLQHCEHLVIRAQEERSILPHEWAAYRQALYDLEMTQSDPFNIDWPKIPVVSPTDRRTQLVNLVDAAAGRARMSFISTGFLVEEEYRQARDEAKGWVSVGSPVDLVPESVSGWALATGMTNTQAAQDIITMATQWEYAINQIRTIRLTAKIAIKASVDDEVIESLARQAINQLDEIRPGPEAF